MKTDFIKYACIALVAGVMVTGGPSYSASLSVINDLGIADLVSADEDPKLPVCGKGDVRCTKEQEGETRKCRKLGGGDSNPCWQRCEKQSDGSYKWTKGYGGQCGKKSAAFGSVSTESTEQVISNF